MSLRGRNGFTSIVKEPIDPADIRAAWSDLSSFWEDTAVVTHPNGVSLRMNVGTLRDVLELAEHEATRQWEERCLRRVEVKRSVGAVRFELWEGRIPHGSSTTSGNYKFATVTFPATGEIREQLVQADRLLKRDETIAKRLRELPEDELYPIKVSCR